jgi:hypothetical protein
VIGPAPILAAIVALFSVSAYVFIRGRAGARQPLLFIAAWLGAWAGDTVGTRLAIDPIRIGEFNLLIATLVAWLAIGLVAIVAILVPQRGATRVREQITTSVRRGTPKEKEDSMPAPSNEPEPQAR